MAFQEFKPNLDTMQQYLSQENSKSNGEGPNWWSFPPGMSSVRILPPWDPTGRVALPVFMHPIEYKGEGMSYTKYNWTCVNKTFNKSCPICEGLAGLRDAGVDTSNWEANRRQFYFNAIVMHDPAYNQQKGTGTAPGTHVLLKSPKTFYDWVVSQITNPMIGDITSVSNGIDILVTKEGSGLGTSYTMTLSPNGRTMIPQEYLDKIKDLYNLDDIFSAGFDQKQIDELVNHLKKSAGVMSNSIPQMQQQMAGYQNMQGYNQMNPGVMPPQFNQAPAMPNQFTANPGVGMPVAPSQFNQTAPVPPQVAPTNFQQVVGQSQMQISPSSSSPATNGANLPKCFGNYDSGSVNCVVCPHEVDCSKSK